MTPYRERREKGYYDPKGEGTKSTTTENLAGLGAPQQAKPKAKATTKKK
jgi:hypothetical protein